MDAAIVERLTLATDYHRRRLGLPYDTPDDELDAYAVIRDQRAAERDRGAGI